MDFEGKLDFRRASMRLGESKSVSEVVSFLSDFQSTLARFEETSDPSGRLVGSARLVGLLRQILLVGKRKWEPLLTKFQKEELLDSIFHPNSAILPYIKLLAIHSSLRQSMRDLNDDSHQRMHISEVEFSLLASDCIKFSLLFLESREQIFGLALKHVAIQESDHLKSEYLQCILDFPNTILSSIFLGQQLKGIEFLSDSETRMAKELFNPAAFFKHLSREVFFSKSEKFIRNESEVLIWSLKTQLLSRLCRRGHAEAVASAWISEMETFEQVTKEEEEEVFLLFRSLSSSDQVSFVSAFISAIECDGMQRQTRLHKMASYIFSLVFKKDLVFPGSALEDLCMRKLFSSSKRLRPPILFALLEHIKQVLEEEKQRWSQLILFVTQIWSDPTFISGSHLNKQRFLSEALVEILRLSSSDELYASGAVSQLVSGVSRFLDCGVSETRIFGMLVAQQFARSLNEEEASFTFSELAKADVDLPELCTLRHDWENQMKRDDLSSSIEELHSSKAITDTTTKCSTSQPVTTTLHSSSCFEDPDEVVSFSRGTAAPSHEENKITKSRSIWSDSSSDEESENSADSDDESHSSSSGVESLLPLENTADDFVGQPFHMPHFLSDCIPILRESNDFRKFSVVVDGLADLIAAEPADLEVASSEMATLLLHLENRFNHPRLQLQRIAALAALASSSEWAKVVQYLAGQVLVECTFTSTRIDGLEALAQAAIKLSSLSPEKSETVKDTNAKPLNIVGTVKRRWGCRTQPEKLAQKNRFAEMAPQFFFPFLSHYAVSLYQRDAIFLAKAVHTLGLILGCAKNSVYAERMARKLVDLLWWSRDHMESKVRRAVLFSLTQTLVVVPKVIMMEDSGWLALLTETRAWVLTLVRGDPDDQVRSQAQVLFNALEPM